MSIETSTTKEYTKGDWDVFQTTYLEAAKAIATQFKKDPRQAHSKYLSELRESIYHYQDIDQIACYLAHKELLEYLNFSLNEEDRDDLLARMNRGDSSILEDFSKAKNLKTMSAIAKTTIEQVTNRVNRDKRRDKTSTPKTETITADLRYQSKTEITDLIKRLQKACSAQEEQENREREKTLEEERQANYKKYKSGHESTIYKLEDEVAKTYESAKTLGVIRTNKSVKKAFIKLLDQWDEQIKSLEDETEHSKDYNKIGRLDAIKKMRSILGTQYLFRTNGIKKLGFDQNVVIQFEQLLLTIDKVGQTNSKYHNGKIFQEFAIGQYQTFKDFVKYS